MIATPSAMAVEVRTTADARGEAAPIAIGRAVPPDRPARPARPDVRAPRDMPPRRPGRPAGRIAFLHAVAHGERNAAGPHRDILARFAHVPMPPGFADDRV
jgi:uncharacterized ferritin-like protein (DUF455 family)